MGVQGLSKLITEVAPQAVKKTNIKNYMGLKVAVDISTSLNQFLFASKSERNHIEDETTKETAHISGTFYRTIRMVNQGIRPVYVFDGRPPTMKLGVVEKRRQRLIDAEKALEKAKEFGNVEEIKKYSSRIVKVDESHIDDCKHLLNLMGIPYIQAPCEAEAQCAELVKGDKVFGVGAEDMDALAFGSKILLRNLTTSERRNIPVREFNYYRILQDFKMSDHQFIDLCILIGCDYCDKINGIGPKRGIKLIQEQRCIENILKVIDRKKYIVPDNWMYESARQLFINPDVISASSVELQWNKPDIEGIVHLMTNLNGFPEGIIHTSVQKLLKLNRVINKYNAKRT